MLQIKNTLGGGKPEGIYVWKKYEYTPAVVVENPTCDIKKNGATLTIVSSNFDINSIVDYKDFFNNFTFNSGTKAFKTESDVLKWCYNTDYGYFVDVNSFTNGVFTLTGSIGSEYTYTNVNYNGTKVLSEEIKEFLDYVVSDKETAYPDGGEKGGYWYEKVIEGINLKSIFNLTDIAVDTFTPTSNLDSINIPHSLGKVPKVALIVARYGDIKSSYKNQITLYGSITEFSMGSGARLSYLNGYDYLGSYINSADWDSSKIIPRSSSSNSLFASGVKYTLITMA